MEQGPKKAALVTGAARGIGHATAKRFLAEGWRVGLIDIDNETLARNHAALGKPDDTLALMHAAHEVCPYSNATRGNVDVQLVAA